MASSWSGIGRQCSVTLIPAFGSTTPAWKPRLQLHGRGRDRDQVRVDAVVDRVHTVHGTLHPVEPKVREPVDGKLAGEERDRAAADDRDPPEPGREPSEYACGLGQRARVLRSLHDR